MKQYFENFNVLTGHFLKIFSSQIIENEAKSNLSKSDRRKVLSDSGLARNTSFHEKPKLSRRTLESVSEEDSNFSDYDGNSRHFKKSPGYSED